MTKNPDTRNCYGQTIGGHNGIPHNDSGTASRFFPQFAWHPDDFAPFLYQGKASRTEREDGLINRIPCAICGELATREHPDGKGGMSRCHRNTHTTVKPLMLMRSLTRLVTPPGGVILDPFCGSGTTLLAALGEGFDAIGCDQSPEYVAIAQSRLDAARAATPLLT